ncbi:hypothetical protein EVA_09127 [gut metagenome]|uniref:Uncharacterized protein n=1 Tax=gut metagenome TaxID=749906 RepID=J9G6A9_9ZZZZ
MFFFRAVNADHLFVHPHQRIQILHRLRDKSDFLSSELFLSFLCQRLPFVIHGSTDLCVIGKDSHDGMGKQAFS